MPVEALQAGYARKFTDIARHQHGLMAQGRRRYQHVVRSDEFANGFQFCTDTGCVA